jgi:hypothetical protein
MNIKVVQLIINIVTCTCMSDYRLYISNGRCLRSHYLTTGLLAIVVNTYLLCIHCGKVSLIVVFFLMCCYFVYVLLVCCVLLLYYCHRAKTQLHLNK